MRKFLSNLLYLIFLGIVSHVIGEAVPRRWVHPDRFPYRPMSWEEQGRIYDRLHIRAWKDRVPDMSRVLRGMTPKRLLPSGGTVQTDQLIRETCVAETTHVLLIPAGLVCLFQWPGAGGTVLFLLWSLGNLPFILIQRYNRPRLIALSGRLSAVRHQEGACVI
ncbi:MAG: glycosyl-4,4'-diaponeurosporenoate acyltransferase [Oscillibacter sp.]|jgi:glycosyl-4,4'-diaponeurosporenoate acyltransferase|nr:glycosyl-4,4'-diaponeurosporenoate acyltransferase [Oscillibacter sp.]